MRLRIGVAASVAAVPASATTTRMRGDTDRRIVRDVILVAQQQLQGVRSRFERDLGLGLAGAEVEVIEVVGNGLVQRRQLGVDQQVVMARVRAIRAGGCHSHLAQTETDGRLGREWSPRP